MKIIVDAAFDCYRAHHAFSRFSNSQGQKTGVFFGFLRAINSYRKRFKGDLLVAWEGKPKSRMELSADYKADREGLPKEIVEQLAPLRDMLRAMGVIQAQHPDWEADDILATQATRIVESGEDAVIVTGDDDLLQVVKDGTPSITVFNPRTKVLHHEAEVVEKYSVGPGDLRTLWAMQGDPSDNIKGVKRLGEAFTVDVVTKYGRLETLLPRIDDMQLDVSQTRDRKLAAIRDNKELVKKNFELLALNTQVKDMVIDEPVRDPKKLETMFKQFELGSFLKNFSVWSNFNG